MRIYAHCREKNGRVTEEEFRVVECIPQKGESFEGETVKEIKKLEAVPEIGMETTNNYGFYKLFLTVKGKYDKDSELYYTDFLAVRKKKFNRLSYLAFRYGNNDEIIYFNDDAKVCRVKFIDKTRRPEALTVLREIKKIDDVDWDELDYEDELEGYRLGKVNVLAEIECEF